MLLLQLQQPLLLTWIVSSHTCHAASDPNTLLMAASSWYSLAPRSILPLIMYAIDCYDNGLEWGSKQLNTITLPLWRTARQPSWLPSPARIHTPVACFQTEPLWLHVPPIKAMPYHHCVVIKPLPFELSGVSSRQTLQQPYQISQHWEYSWQL